MQKCNIKFRNTVLSLYKQNTTNIETKIFGDLCHIDEQLVFTIVQTNFSRHGRLSGFSLSLISQKIMDVFLQFLDGNGAYVPVQPEANGDMIFI